MIESNLPFANNTLKSTYLVGSVIVIVGIVIGTAVILAGTPYFAQMLPIFSGGVIWFLVVLPGTSFWTTKKSGSR